MLTLPLALNPPVVMPRNVVSGTTRVCPPPFDARLAAYWSKALISAAGSAILVFGVSAAETCVTLQVTIAARNKKLRDSMMNCSPSYLLDPAGVPGRMKAD
jgi:hypothetical protein